MKLTDKQKLCKEHIVDRITSNPCSHQNHHYKSFHVSVAGYAGTGKTFLISEISKELHKMKFKSRMAFVTFTGKASSVLKEFLTINNAILNGDFLGTIHSLIYKPIMKYDRDIKKHIVIGWKKKDNVELDTDVIFIDEASMVSKNIWDDLKSYGRVIIIFGDNGQLPPIEDSFNLLKNPDIQLIEIHRQAHNSPIIKLAHYVRNSGFIPSNRMYSKGVFKLSWADPRCREIFDNITIDENTIILCGFNQSRVVLNKMIRDKFNYSNVEPYPNERIINLKNNYDIKLMNGQIGTMIWYIPISKHLFKITIDVDGKIYECLTSDSQFGKVSYDMYEKKISKTIFKKAKELDLNVGYFDYGYAISVHKAQGSEWDRVILFEQRSKYWDNQLYTKWLYTGITRAKKKLFIISDFY